MSDFYSAILAHFITLINNTIAGSKQLLRNKISFQYNLFFTIVIAVMVGTMAVNVCFDFSALEGSLFSKCTIHQEIYIQVDLQQK